MSSGCTENPVTLWKLAAAAPHGVLIPALLSPWVQTDSVVLWGAERNVCGGDGGVRGLVTYRHTRKHTHTNTSINTLTRTHWVPLMMIIRAFRGCPWGQAGDWGVIFTLKRPMIGSDCDNDHHYCHYSVKWLREKENFKKVDWGFLYLFFVLWLGWVLRRKEYETSRLLSLLYINHNSTISKDTKLVRWGQWGTEKWSVILGCSKS